MEFWGLHLLKTEQTGAPFISVLVAVHDRKQYIKGAVDSVFAQTLDPAAYEVVVVANFAVAEELTPRPNMVCIQTAEKEHEGKIAVGVENCRGEVICFLDDDDTWESTKLQAVHDLFGRNVELCYYHNGFRMIDELGRPVQQATLRILQRRMHRVRRMETDRRKASFGVIRKMIKIGVNFNMSCITIRKHVVLSFIEHLRGLNGKSSNVDTFMLYAALLSGGKLFADDRELTLYRIHGRNTSATFISAGTHPEELGYRTLLEMAGTSKGNAQIRRSIECMVSDIMFELYSKEKVRDRKRMAREIINHMRYFSFYDMQYDVLLSLFGILYLISPALGEIMHSIPGEHL